jgi:hypothetical protein
MGAIGKIFITYVWQKILTHFFGSRVCKKRHFQCAFDDNVRATLVLLSKSSGLKSMHPLSPSPYSAVRGVG